MTKNLKFSETVSKLEKIISRLETGELELEEVDKLVSEGLMLLDAASTQLTKLEGKVEKILKEK